MGLLQYARLSHDGEPKSEQSKQKKRLTTSLQQPTVLLLTEPWVQSAFFFLQGHIADSHCAPGPPGFLLQYCFRGSESPARIASGPRMNSPFQVFSWFSSADWGQGQPFFAVLSGFLGRKLEAAFSKGLMGLCPLRGAFKLRLLHLASAWATVQLCCSCVSAQSHTSLILTF